MKNKSKLLVILLLLAFMAPILAAGGGEEKILPHGLKWGTAKAEVQSIMEKNTAGINGFKYNPEEQGYSDIFLGKEGRREMYFAENKLIGYDLDFEYQSKSSAMAFYNKLVGYYASKYGAGKATAKYEKTWIVGNTAIIVHKHFTDVDTAHLAFRPID